MMSRSNIQWYDGIQFRGHKSIRSLHPTTLEITTEEELTTNGTCIIGVGSDKGCADLSEDLKKGISRNGSRLVINLVVGENEFIFSASGSVLLPLTHPQDIVIRKSDFYCPRTVAIESSAAAIDIPRRIVEELKNPKTIGTLRFGVLV
jgi:hypothetical protein